MEEEESDSDLDSGLNKDLCVECVPREYVVAHGLHQVLSSIKKQGSKMRVKARGMIKQRQQLSGCMKDCRKRSRREAYSQ